MELNEIKKILYREKPLARLTDGELLVNHGGETVDCSVYKASTSVGLIKFVIPHSEMGPTRFEDRISAQLLIRWVQL